MANLPVKQFLAIKFFIFVLNALIMHMLLLLLLLFFLAHKKSEKSNSIRGILDKFDLSKLGLTKTKMRNFPWVKVGRQRRPCQQQRTTVLSHTPSPAGGWKMHDLVVLHQSVLPDVTVGTKKATSSAWMQVVNYPMIPPKKANLFTYLLFVTAKCNEERSLKPAPCD